MSTSGVLQCLHVETVVHTSRDIRMSSKYPTVLDCLHEIGQRIQREHDPTCVAATQKLQVVDDHAVSTKRPSDERVVSPNVTDVLMIHIRLKIIQEHAAEANKTALDAEKETRDELVTSPGIRVHKT